MIPLRDNIPARTAPVVNYLLIGLCTLAFIAQLAEPGQSELLVEKFGMIPQRVFHPDKPIVIEEIINVGYQQYTGERRELADTPFNPWLTLLTCIFLHGGWLHFLGNMWFLHIFGDNVEDRLGHVGYFIFYLASGLFASFAHLLTNTDSPLPTIGASGAIAGVMGAYLLLYPNGRVVTLVPIIFFIQILVLPAPVFLGIWFLLQFLQGFISITDVRTTGVAWWAHIGGFAFGFLLTAIMSGVGRTRPSVKERIPGTERLTYRRSG